MNKNQNKTTKHWHVHSNNENIWVNWRFLIIEKILKKKFKLNKKYKCLDVGCGNENFSMELENITNFIVDSSDVDKRIIKKKNIKRRGKFYLYDIEKKNLKKKYDIIFLLDVLEHIKNEKKFLQSVFFHLKKNGYLILNVPSIPYLYSKYDISVGHIRRYNKNMVYEIFNNKKIVSISYWGLTLVPVLFLRKILIDFFLNDKKNIVNVGMNTKNILINNLMKILRFIDLNIFKSKFYGTSIIAIIKK